MIVAIWILAGVACDIFVMWFLSVNENQNIDKFIAGLEERDGTEFSSDRHYHSIASMAGESPWWGHLIIVLCWPVAILRIAM